jgi:N-acyl-phosphatidylethanolamine-hydrolysing phospholipase D
MNSHHTKTGHFVNPWPKAARSVGRFAMLRWQWQRIRDGVPPTPAASQFPTQEPMVARPAGSPDELRLTWLGQATFLLQIGGANLLTDPVLSKRASPFASLGPSRIVAAPLTVAELPPIDAVLISHDHYDHLDARTCALLVDRFGRDLQFLTPLGYRAWFSKLGAVNVVERDWWQTARIGELDAICTPSQHWTRRIFAVNTRLWSSWLVRAHHHSVYFCGDSGYAPAFREVRDRLGSPDIALMPIGAYEPRWFMKSAHMNPEEAVQAYLDLGAKEFVAMHWGTFKLTDEPMLEPPVRTRTAWAALGLPAAGLHIPKHGETLTWRATTRSTT